MGTSASKRPSKSLHHGVCIPKPSILPVAMRQQHLYPVYTIYIYNYAEKHMALSQLFSREKPFHKNPMVSNLDFPMKMAVSPSGKSPPGHPGQPRSPRKLPIPPPCSRSPVDLSPGWELGITSFYNPYVNHGAGI